MDGERELVELVLRAARPLGLVVGLPALLELVDGLAVARGYGERLAADGHLGVLAGQVDLGRGARLLGALQIGLRVQHLGDGDGAPGAHGATARDTGGADGVHGLLEHRLATQASAQLIGQLLTRTLFSALAEGPDPLEPEREGGRLHVPYI